MIRIPRAGDVNDAIAAIDGHPGRMRQRQERHRPIRSKRHHEMLVLACDEQRDIGRGEHVPERTADTVAERLRVDRPGVLPLAGDLGGVAPFGVMPGPEGVGGLGRHAAPRFWVGAASRAAPAVRLGSPDLLRRHKPNAPAYIFTADAYLVVDLPPCRRCEKTGISNIR